MGVYKFWNPATSQYEIIKSKSIINADGTNEYTPDQVKAIDDKIGILNGAGATKEKANKVDLDSHLAEIVPQAAANKIPRALEDGKLDIGWIPSDGAWEKIAELTLGSSAAQVDFANIPSGYKNLKIYFDSRSYNTTAGSLKITFNNDINTNYRIGRISANGSTLSSIGQVSTAYITLGMQSMSASNMAHAFGFAEISNFDETKAKRVIATAYSETTSAADGMWLSIMSGSWNNTTEEINKITISPIAQSIGAGSRFVLWGCK